MLNLKRKSDKPVTCEVPRSSKCEGKVTEFNFTRDGKRICKACTNL